MIERRDERFEGTSEHIVSAPSVSAFKNRLIQFKSVFNVIFMCNAWLLFLCFYFAVFC